MTHDIPAMDKLLDWLLSHVPDADITTVVHGDFRYMSADWSCDHHDAM